MSQPAAMTKYKVRVYEAGFLGLLTQADQYRDYEFENQMTSIDFAGVLARQGFSIEGGRKWILPASILTVEVVDE